MSELSSACLLVPLLFYCLTTSNSLFSIALILELYLIYLRENIFQFFFIPAFKKKTTRKISQAVKPKNILKNLKKSGIGKRATKTLDSIRSFKPQNIGKSKLFKNIQGFLLLPVPVKLILR